MISLHEEMTIDLPEMDTDGLKIQRFEIEPHSIGNLRNALDGRGTQPGVYTKLVIDGHLWMSDVDAEKRDHLEPLLMMRHHKARRVLINGLGLGMVVKAALTMDHIEHIDVVERDERVATLIGPHYEKTGRVTVHHADAYAQAKLWAPGTRWDVGWSDIWADPSTDDLKDMARLNRSYGRRCDWHGCWAQRDLQSIARRGWR
jgi:hypothetical protein